MTCASGDVKRVAADVWEELQRRQGNLWANLGGDPPLNVSRPAPGSGNFSTKPMTPAELDSIRAKINNAPPSVRRGLWRAMSRAGTVPAWAALGRVIPTVGGLFLAVDLGRTAGEWLASQALDDPIAGGNAFGAITYTSVDKGDEIITHSHGGGEFKAYAPTDGWLIAREDQLFGVNDSALEQSCNENYSPSCRPDKADKPLEVGQSQKVSLDVTVAYNGFGSASSQTFYAAGRQLYTFFKPSSPEYGPPAPDAPPGTKVRPSPLEPSESAMDAAVRVQTEEAPGDITDEEAEAVQWVTSQPEMGLPDGDRPPQPGAAPEPTPTPTPTPQAQPAPAEVTIPTWEPGTTFDVYSRTLTDVGLQAAKTVSTDAASDPDYAPDAVTKASPPPGTKVPVGTRVAVTVNSPNTSAGGAGCEPWATPSINLDPLKVPLTQVYPFGIPFWIKDALSEWLGDPEVPEWTFRFPFTPGDEDMVISLAIFDEHMPEIRAVLGGVAILSMMWLFLSLAFGGPSAPSASKDD